MAKVTDVHVRRLFGLLGEGRSLGRAARMAGIDRKTARRYRNMRRLPSEKPDAPRTWRTRSDPFVEVWPEVAEQLAQEPGLQAKTLWEWLRQKYSGRFDDGQLRTLQRRIHDWRATQGPSREVYFSQVHHPGRLCASDFTHMNSLNVTIGGQRFDHLVYHFVLTYSNWESVTICFSESFESLSEGLQNALQELGGVPERHRSDRMSAAVNNLSERRDFTARYQDLLAHYGLTGEKIQAAHGNENGDAESSQRHFKEAVEQMLLLRGSREFASRQEYATFLDQVCRQRNANRSKHLAEERALLRPLPTRRLESCQRLTVTVSSGSVIHVQNNVYSVASRLIGERVEVRIYPDHLDVWYGATQVETLPRLRGRGQQHINYRHVIDTLVRKPGALAHYRYRDGLFPTSRFRMAFDQLQQTQPLRADRDYLAILHLAAHENEALVDDALRVLIEAEQSINAAAVKAQVNQGQPAPLVTAVCVPAVDLMSFDTLLTETIDEPEQGRDGEVVGRSQGTAAADHTEPLRGPGPARGERDAVVRTVSVGTESAGVRDPADVPHRTTIAPIPPSADQGLAEFRSQALTDEGRSTSPHPAGRVVPRSPREHLGVRPRGFGQDASAVGVRAGIDPGRTQNVLLHLQLVGAAFAGRQTRLEVEPNAETTQPLRWLDHRRHRLCPAESGGDGNLVYALGRALRTWQRAVDQQLAVLEMGDDLQRPDDNRRGHRSLSASQRHPGIEHPELSAGASQEGDPSGDRHQWRHLRPRAAGTGRPREPWGFLIVTDVEM